VQQEGPLIDGRYRIEEKLGQGGMGAVHRVTDLSTGDDLALKQLTLRSETAHLRFRREFHVMARLRHPHIVEVCEYGIDRDSRPYYTMELIGGSDLRDIAPAATETACRILRDVASALALLHSRRLIHRDLSARNVRLTLDGQAKLIDFGVLATAGAADDIAGTPPLMAPESYHGLPLDHRVDLFGLGGLAYYVLTGRHAYPARRIDDLEALWRQIPPPPSTIAPSVPESLDDLVMALISLDPLGRPPAAAEVIDRLSAVAALPPADDVEARRGYLASSVLVGRQPEMRRIRQRIERTVRGKGGGVLVLAPTGMGKSRLLREAALEAQVAGAVVASASGSHRERGPLGVARAIVSRVLAVVPDDARETLGEWGPIIARVIPEVGSTIGVERTGRPADDPTEKRLRLLGALTDWLTALARRRPLVLLVDDLQRVDEVSCALLTALADAGTDTPLLVVGAQRTDEPERAPFALDKLRSVSASLQLHGLSAAEVGDLVRALFGEISNAERLAQWLRRLAGGSPLHCTEVARDLVERDVIRYSGGMWLVPDQLSGAQERRPAALADTLDARVAALSPGARQLAQVLGVHGGDVSLGLCIALGRQTDEVAVFAALDELVNQEVLVGSREHYRFRHDGLREALLRDLDQRRMRELHLLVGQVLAQRSGGSAELEAEVGWHLLKGGEEQRGADLLARSGRQLYEAQSFADAILPLEAALEVYERVDRPAATRLALRQLLMVAGCLADSAVALRYADGTIAAFSEHSGLVVARRFGALLGRRLGLAIGLAWAGLRRLFTPRRRRGPRPTEALIGLFQAVTTVAVVTSMSFDIPRTRQLVRMLEPLQGFRRRIPGAVYLTARNLLDVALGRGDEVCANARRVLEIVSVDRSAPIGEMERKMLCGTAHFMLGIHAMMNLDPAFEEQMQALERLELRFFDVAALMIRTIDRRLRGEEEVAQRMERQLEVLFVQAGSMWLWESELRWVSATTYGVTRDVLGLRRCIEKIRSFIDRGFNFHKFLAIAEGHYHRERGDLAASRERLEWCLETMTPDDDFIRTMAMTALAETLLAAGEAECAREMACRALAEIGELGRMNVLHWARASQVLAQAEMACGELLAASGRLERTLAALADRPNPTVHGGLHEARAMVALAAGDPQAFQLHLLEMERWFFATRNPTLIARVARLKRLASRQQVGVPAATAPRAENGEDTTVGLVSPSSLLLVSCRGHDERALRALRLILASSGASAGYLFLVRGGRAGLAALIGGDEPPADVERQVQEAIDMADSSCSQRGGQPPEPSLLWLRQNERAVVVGAAVCPEGRTPNPGLLERLANELYAAGDVTARATSQQPGAPECD